MKLNLISKPKFVVLQQASKTATPNFFWLSGARQTKPNQTKPNQTKPTQTKPNQTKPSQAKPNQNKPNPKLQIPWVSIGYPII